MHNKLNNFEEILSVLASVQVGKMSIFQAIGQFRLLPKTEKQDLYLHERLILKTALVLLLFGGFFASKRIFLENSSIV